MSDLETVRELFPDAQIEDPVIQLDENLKVLTGQTPCGIFVVGPIMQRGKDGVYFHRRTHGAEKQRRQLAAALGGVARRLPCELFDDTDFDARFDEIQLGDNNKFGMIFSSHTRITLTKKELQVEVIGGNNVVHNGRVGVPFLVNDQFITLLPGFIAVKPKKPSPGILKKMADESLLVRGQFIHEIPKVHIIDLATSIDENGSEVLTGRHISPEQEIADNPFAAE